MNITMTPHYFGSEALSRPALLSTRSAMKQRWWDAGAFFAAGLCAGSAPTAHYIAALPQAAMLTLWCVLFFQLLGLYRRSYAVFARDELYFAAVAIVLAFTPLLLVTMLPQFQRLFLNLFLTMSVSIAFCGVTRTMLFKRRQAKHEDKKTSITFPISAPGFITLFSKRIIDILLGLLACLLFFPFLLIASIGLFIESGFPIFFRQDRVGKGGRSFQIIKFRTMRPNTDSGWALPGDDRITPLGSILRRFSVDEMPQIINVLRGEMSIVGPRPEWRTFADEFAVTLPHYNDRHFVNPGITGWAQIYMNRNLAPSDAPVVLLHDLFYISHCSVYLDFCIILKTAVEFLFHRAI